MTEFLRHAWLLIKLASFGGVAVAVAGVAIFGWHFILINARAAREGDEIPAASWRGKGAMLGIGTLALGITMQVTSFILATMLRHGF
jgi:hypothetical protein